MNERKHTNITEFVYTILLDTGRRIETYATSGVFLHLLEEMPFPLLRCMYVSGLS